jgi:Uma2 family endonuclease
VSTAHRVHYGYDEYLRLLEENDVKLEYCDGNIYAMAGGTVAHARLCGSMIRLLARVLPRGCEAIPSDAKVRIEATDLSTFPDVTVVCGEIHTSEIDPHAIVNPSILVEVTSRSTEEYDRGDKLGHYKQLASLRATLFVSHRERRVTIVERTADGWKETERRGGETVTLETPATSFAVDDLYAEIALDTA